MAVSAEACRGRGRAASPAGQSFCEEATRSLKKRRVRRDFSRRGNTTSKYREQNHKKDLHIISSEDGKSWAQMLAFKQTNYKLVPGREAQRTPAPPATNYQKEAMDRLVCMPHSQQTENSTLCKLHHQNAPPDVSSVIPAYTFLHNDLCNSLPICAL